MEEYDQVTAAHYKVYRPPLHSIILSKILGPQKTFQKALDIGCGVGHSTLSLSNYCTEVIGLETSKYMLHQALPHSKVRYIFYKGAQLNFPKNTFDLISFAGSLYYAKSKELFENMIQVAKPAATILVYDFEIHLDGVLKKLQLEELIKPSFYNHEEDFSDVRYATNIIQKKKIKEQLTFSLTDKEFVHLLLSYQAFYKKLLNKFGKNDLEQQVLERISKQYPAHISQLNASINAVLYVTTKRV